MIYTRVLIWCHWLAVACMAVYSALTLESRVDHIDKFNISCTTLAQFYIKQLATQLISDIY